MTAITDNGFARITKESLVRNPSTSGSISWDSIAYDPLTTINEKINSLTVSWGSQALIQFKDEGVNLWTIWTAQVVDFTWAGLSASRVGNVVTVNSTAAGDMVLASAQTNSWLKTFLDSTLGLRNVANTFTSLFTNLATAARTWTLPDASGTIVIGWGTASWANTWDVTLAGAPTYLTIAGQVITRALINLTSHVTWTLPEANWGTGITALGAGVGTFLWTPTSANLRGALTDETGSGAAVFATSPTLTTPAIASIKWAVVTDTDGATITFDKNAWDFHRVVLGGNRTLALSNIAAGDKIVIDLVQDWTWTRTVTWFTTIKWVWGTTPTLTTTINKIDTFGFICTSAGNYQGYIIWQNL